MISPRPNYDDNKMNIIEVSDLKINTSKTTYRERESKKGKRPLTKFGREKDELEYATNWFRAFNNIFVHLKWLNAYASINYIAS